MTSASRQVERDTIEIEMKGFIPNGSGTRLWKMLWAKVLKRSLGVLAPDESTIKRVYLERQTRKQTQKEIS